MLLAVAAMVVACVVYVATRDSLTEVASRALHCSREADAACLWHLMTKEEKEAYGLSEGQFRAFVGEYVKPRLTPARVLSSDGVTFPGGTMAVSTEQWLMPDGLSFSFGMVAAKTDDGPRCIAVITSILLAVAILQDQAARDRVTGEEKLRVWAEHAERDHVQLESLGIHGLLRDANEGFIPWAEWIKSCRSRYEKAISERKSAGN